MIHESAITNITVFGLSLGSNPGTSTQYPLHFFYKVVHQLQSPMQNCRSRTDNVNSVWEIASVILVITMSRLVIGTSRTVGSAKKFVRITSGFGRGEFTKTLRKVKNWNFLFYCSNIAKSENAMLWRMLSRLETCIVYCCIWNVTLAKSIVPRKAWRKLWHSYISKLFLTKMQVKFQYFFIMGV